MSIEMDQHQEPKRQQLEWRRGRIAELSAQGRTEREIASILRVGKTTVNRDLAYLNKQARENLKVHVQERLPEQYEKCLNGLT
jgi:transposase